MNDMFTKHSTWDNTRRAISTRTPNVYSQVADEVADEMAIPKSSETRGHNDSRDAFRHAYISALTTYRHGETAATVMGDANEAKNNFPFGNGNPPLEEWMDQENNRLGREIALETIKNGGTEEDLKIATKQALESGTLIETPYDPRRTYHEHGDWDKAVKESAERIKADKEKRLKILDASGQNDPKKRADVERVYKQHTEKVEQVSKQTQSSRLPSKPSDTRTGPSRDPNPTTVERSNAGGEVFVHSYSRRTGDVQSHTRSSPDGNTGNNFGARGGSPKSGSSAGIREPGPNEKRIPGVLYLNK
jgi:hypothetical protein